MASSIRLIDELWFSTNIAFLDKLVGTFVSRFVHIFRSGIYQVGVQRSISLWNEKFAANYGYFLLRKFWIIYVYYCYGKLFGKNEGNRIKLHVRRWIESERNYIKCISKKLSFLKGEKRRRNLIELYTTIPQILRIQKLKIMRVNRSMRND